MDAELSEWQEFQERPMPTKRHTAPKTRNPQDATLRNIRALKARVKALEARMTALEKWPGRRP